MKYSQLISFNPIEDVIQLVTAENKDKAREYVKTYVMSDSMAEALQAPMIDQLQMDEVVDNKGVLVVGNYGTGKSHLMSVISAVATDADNVQYLQNEKFKQQVQPIAGKFEVLRIEIGGVVMPLYDVIMGYVQDDFDRRGISFEAPEYSSVKSIKTVIQDMMMAFSAKYPDKGYLIVVDEFLSYLSSRNEREIVLDLEFFRALGEMCSKSKLRVIFGMQEKIFDNPRFSFVADTLKHVSDRFTQLIITKEATSYVVSERILKKTPEQKALIRKHLEKFCGLYTGISFVCSLQVQSFRKINGITCATTMCTGNLRSATECIIHYRSAKDKNMLLNSLKYYGIVFFFIVGAAISSFVTKALNQKSIIFCAFGLLVILALMFIKSEEITEK